MCQGGSGDGAVSVTGVEKTVLSLGRCFQRAIAPVRVMASVPVTASGPATLLFPLHRLSLLSPVSHNARVQCYSIHGICAQMKKMRTIKVRELSDELTKKKNRGRRDIMDNTVHWAEKAVTDMTERDWRIFKEDFMIVTKGQV